MIDDVEGGGNNFSTEDIRKASVLKCDVFIINLYVFQAQ